MITFLLGFPVAIAAALGGGYVAENMLGSSTLAGIWGMFVGAVLLWCVMDAD